MKSSPLNELFSQEAEQSVLGGLILNNEAWHDISEILVETDFYHHQNQILFRAIKRLSEDNQPADPVTLTNFLQSYQFDLERVGGGNYLAQLVGNTPGAANIIAYANIVRERSILRQLSQTGIQIANSVQNPNGKDSQKLLSEAEQAILSIANQRQCSTHFKPVSEILGETLSKLEQLAENPEAFQGLQTGFAELDSLTTGLQPGDLIIIAGRPSMGKTAFAMNIAQHIAVDQQIPVAVFSMEMSDEQLTLRLISSLAQVNLQSVRTGQFNDDEWSKITQGVPPLNNAPLFIEDLPALEPAVMRSIARRLKREQPSLGLIIVDYLQLMSSPGETRNDEITTISQALKNLAKELKVPVIALSQLNRNLENRQDKRPKMADLRESGSIEQTADLILFIYRDEVYEPNSVDKGVAEIIIGKQRNGPLGVVKLNFKSNTVSFLNGEFYYEEN